MPYSLSGVTRNANGAPLGSVTVDVFDTATDTLRGTGISDGSGNYEVSWALPSATVYAVAYLVGSPDVAGTTLNTLVPESTGSPTYYYLGF